MRWFKAFGFGGFKTRIKPNAIVDIPELEGHHCWESFSLAASYLFLLFRQKSSTRRSDPNLPDTSDVGIYDEMNKLAGLGLDGECCSLCVCVTRCIDVR